MLIINCSLNLSKYFPAMKFCFWNFPFNSRYCRVMHTEKQTLKLLDMHVEFNIFLIESDFKSQQAKILFWNTPESELFPGIGWDCQFMMTFMGALNLT